MTKREAAIVSAYTGCLIGEFSDFQAYVEEIMGRPIFTHELPMITDELKEASKKDFISIKIEEEPPKWLYHTPFEEYSWVDFDAVEKALGFQLFSWQKEYIDLGCGYADRRTGRTTAQILHHLLNIDEKPIDFSMPPLTRREAIAKQNYRDIWEKLRDAGIPTRAVFWNKEDKEFYKKGLNKFDPYKYAREAFTKYEADNHKHNHTCSDCSQFRYDRVNGIYYCSRRAFGNIYQAEEMFACDDFEKGEQNDN